MTTGQTATYRAKNRITSYAKDTYLLILTGLFAQTDTEYKWDPDPDISKIVISDRFQAPTDWESFKPMIYLHRGRMAYSNSAIDKLAARDMHRHSTTYSDLIQGTMVINSISSEGLEAEEIASMLFTVLQAYNKEFMKLGFQHMVVNEILEERVIDTGYDHKLVEVPIITSFTFQHTWCVQNLDLKVLRDICIQRSHEVEPSDPCDTSGTTKCGRFGPNDDPVLNKALLHKPPCSFPKN